MTDELPPCDYCGGTLEETPTDGVLTCDGCGRGVSRSALTDPADSIL